MQETKETFIPAQPPDYFHNFVTTFEKMESSDFQLIFEHGNRISFPRDAVILRQDQTNNSLYVITQGTVRIERRHDDVVTELAKLGPWSVFGEMSYLDKLPVSADVVTDEFSTLIRIDGTDIEDFITQVPGFAHRFYQSLAITISRRLRTTSSYV